MERKKKKEGSGFYIAICCCVVIIAAVGYANRVSVNEETVPEQQVAQATMVPEKVAEEKKTVAAATAKPKPTPEVKAQAEAVSKGVKTEEKVVFSAPVKGKVIEEFSGDDLVYNESLKDWRSHSGVDFAADIGEKVVCSAAGVVEKVFDSELGHCVVIDHKNGYRTMYANLKEDTGLSEGDDIAAGDVVGMVGDTALGDSTDLPHLHFEIMKKNESLNPVDYLE